MSILENFGSTLPRERISCSAEQIADHSYDAWPVAVKWRQQGKQPCKPDAVVKPLSTDEVVKVLKWADECEVVVTPWGLGSSVTGAPLSEHGGVVIDISGMDKVLKLDKENLMVSVEAGKRGDVLEAELNTHGFTLNHSPQSLDRSTIGGWVATRATGQFSSMYGGTEDLLLALTVVIPDGRVVKTKQTPRAAIGLDTKSVFLGSEGTLGVVTEVTMKIFPQKSYRRLEAIEFDDVGSGVRALREITRSCIKPFLVRFYDKDESRHAMKNSVYEQCAMFLGFEGFQTVADAQYDEVMKICVEQGGRAIGPDAVEAWMNRRYDFSAIENVLARPGGVAETIEISDFWGNIEGTYHALKSALKCMFDEVLCHFSHVYAQGTSLYVILIGNADDARQSEELIRKAWDITMNICLQRGATTSHHHGVGLARKGVVADDQGSGMIVNQAIKNALDPKNIMNPGKLGFKV